jgi:hypothetical protein
MLWAASIDCNADVPVAFRLLDIDVDAEKLRLKASRDPDSSQAYLGGRSVPPYIHALIQGRGRHVEGGLGRIAYEIMRPRRRVLPCATERKPKACMKPPK